MLKWWPPYLRLFLQVAEQSATTHLFAVFALAAFAPLVWVLMTLSAMLPLLRGEEAACNWRGIMRFFLEGDDGSF